MLRYILTIFLLSPVTALSAEPSSQLWAYLSGADVVSASEIFEQASRERPKEQIVDFEVELENEQLSFEVSLYNSTTKQITELSYDDAGVLVGTEFELDEWRGGDQLLAIKTLLSHPKSIDELISDLSNNRPGELIAANIGSNLSIPFLWVTLLTVEGKQSYAIDLKSNTAIPILQM
ncbi:hypothetical protein [Ferrimonas kyonanensis]|uniref:hypothetical protein n=1 Tax=Ferrimonas kyonanensis TaxID=364763 RepID=UPI000488B0FC|nr:hypothetical protein [Ferrimonas kyonanensis]